MYNYKCPKCGEKFEKYNVRPNEDSATCPKCQSPAPKDFTTWGALSWGKSGHWNKGV